ncbi:MAG: response regulator [Melioribacteraceae bacterium]|nr:response regulator [Melioribacteraceae bacterium]
MALFILAVIIFIIADILIRFIIKRVNDKKIVTERAKALDVSLNLDFSTEAKSLKRAEVPNPKAKILCVDDEAVILDSFRKILVLDGYSVDTVESGKEALHLIQSHHYDFLFTDLKMPEMDGVDVAKSVKHLRPDIDVIIITGYATVETAVEVMKFGAMDYVQKPFTEDELLEFTKKSLFKRQDRIKKQLLPKVHISHLSGEEYFNSGEFAIPGGVFISKDHCWVGIDQDGNAKIGIDDFAKKLIGKIDDIEFPNLGMNVKVDQPLFSIKQGRRHVTFGSPISGNVTFVNDELVENLDSLEISPYEQNWICKIDAENLDTELRTLNIGNSAVSFYQNDITKYQEEIKKIDSNKKESQDQLFKGELAQLDDYNFDKLTSEFFLR